ncbi:hypothetical protein Vsou_24090 [Vulcanisaeta souniana JCM 11219]|uniref:Uncharacterized protein n=1 Tax=Vulcanisaeta souniana JCM 11219 TaxID=1293586 RepID=A0ABN6SW91_9CREN|nr:hypothetical protein Vsou_24090 [Vulcanisaeta souniana JCM 11219]
MVSESVVNIAFMENDKVEVEFNNVENPRNLMNKIENIVKA